MLTVLYGILAIILLIVLEAATLLVYFILRKTFAHRKILNEIIIMAFAVACSLAVRFVVVLAMDGEKDALGGMATGLYVLYSMLGGFSFEGSFALSEMAESVRTLWQCLYYGVAAYAGITFLMVASVRLSFEWYSYICICFRRLFKSYDRRYIFTDVSDESLLLAEDIKKKEEGRGGSYVIIFTGSELEPFDKKNPNHREVMENGFYYYSYEKRSGRNREPSLLKKFHYSAKSVAKHDKKPFTHNKQIHIFTLRGDENLRGAENKNSDIIFDDIRSVLNDYYTEEKGVKSVNIPTPINYYLLTHNDINHEFYKNHLNKIITEFLEERGICLNEKQTAALLGRFQLHLLNEALLTARDMIREVQKSAFADAETRDGQKKAYALYRGYMGMDADSYRTAVFGFGKTGQYALKELFINTSKIASGGKLPARFIADVYDGDVDRFSGEFAYSHPLFFCRSGLDDKKPLSDDELVKWALKVKGEAIDELCEAQNTDGVKRTNEQLKKKVFDEMGFPIINFRAVSCFKKDFISSIDDTMGIDRSGVDYRSYLICMGSDESNLTLANLLIDDFKHEILLTDKKDGDKENAENGENKAENKAEKTDEKKTEKTDEKDGRKCKTIFVHIRDEKSTARINWTENDKKAFAGKLAVVCFGCRKDVWSYSQVVDDDFNGVYNYTYNIMSLKLQEAEKNKVKNIIIEEKDGNIRVNDQKFNLHDVMKDNKYKDDWLKIDSYLKESNASVRWFALNYNFYDNNIDDAKEYYCRLEHLRWSRFYMSNGWIYARYENKEERDFRRHNKEHNCLCPYDIMKKGIKSYDYLNVLLGKSADLSLLLD